MSTSCRFVLNSALIVSSMAGAGCALIPPLSLSQRRCDRCDMKMSSARLEEGRGNLEEAKRLYAEVQQKNPRNAECLHRLGAISTEQKRLDQADAYYRQAYAIDSNNPGLLADMGYAAFLRKEFEQAEMFFEKSVSLNGRDQVAIGNLAITRAWREKDADSLATFRLIYGEVESIRRLAAIQGARGDNERCQKNLELAARLNSSVLTASLSGMPNPYGAGAQSLAEDASKTIETTSLEETTPNEAPNAVPKEIPNAVPNETMNNVPKESLDTVPDTDPKTTLNSAKVPVLTVQQVSNCSLPVPAHVIQPTAFGETLMVATDVGIEIIPASRATSNGLSVADNSVQSDSPIVITPLNFKIVAKASSSSVAAVPEAAFDLDATPSEKVATPPEKTESSVEWNAVSSNEWHDQAEPVIPTMEHRRDPDPDEDMSIKQASAWRRVPPVETSSTVNRNRMGSIKEAVWNVSPASAVTKRAEENRGLKAICLVTLVEEQKMVPSMSEFSAEFQSQTYNFSSKEACEKFRRDPLRYAPVAGGLDVVSVRDAKTVEQGSVDFAVWYRRQLYLFTCAEHAEAFRREPRLFVSAE